MLSIFGVSLVLYFETGYKVGLTNLLFMKPVAVLSKLAVAVLLEN
jgi:hypothetical protein